MSNLSEKEKYAIKELTEIKELVEEDLQYAHYKVTATLNKIDLKSLVIVLNLLEKQDKIIKQQSYTNKKIRNKLKTVRKERNKQQKEIEQEKEKNKELDATLKQTQDSWYEDTKKIELNNECEIALNNRIIDLENELNKEKEKNKKQEKQIEKLLNIKLYACDENKNKECNKKHCYINGGECDRTTDITKVKYINLDEYISKNKIREKIEEFLKELLQEGDK